MKVRVKRILVASLLSAGAFLSVRHALGDRNFTAYFEKRRAVKSLESGFPELERCLRRAVRLHPAPDLLEELGGLYLDVAHAANAYGTAVKRTERDTLLARAEAAYRRLLRMTPTRASAWYDLGRVYLLTNFPVLPYEAKGRACIRAAMELAPADPFINENGLFLFLIKWPALAEGERVFVRKRAADAARDNPGYIASVRAMWSRSFPGVPIPDGVFPPGL